MNKEKINHTISNPRGLNRLLSLFTVESPFFILFVLIVVIFTAEGMIMYILNRLPPISPLQEGILDAAILTISVFPVLYIFVFRPLVRQLRRRQEAEQALELSKDSFDNIIRKNIDGILVVNHAKKIQFINPAAETLLNCKAEDCLYQPFEYPLDLGGAANIDIICQNGEVGTGEMQVGDTEWQAQPAHLVVLRDITERISVQEALQESEEQFRSLALSAIDAIVGLDKYAHISIWNKAA